MSLITLAICACLCVLYADAYALHLDDRFSVDWEFNHGEITFTIEANGTGWVGLGFGPHMGMREADLVIGGVRNGKGYLYDLYGIDNDTPALDSQQNYDLLQATETAGHTTLKFKRKLDTGDRDDVALTNPVYLLWAFNSDDDATKIHLPYHGTDRGHEQRKRTFS